MVIDIAVILLIHGYGDTADGWRRVIPGLLPRHRVVAVDVPPFGRSSDPRAPRLIDFYADYFPELLHELGMERATVIGHSLGGAIALHLTLERPELYRRDADLVALRALPLATNALTVHDGITAGLNRRGPPSF